jgi:deoxyribodipyrimidine photolyase-related protein
VSTTALRHLVIAPANQLNLDATALHDFDPSCDAVWMAEVMQESTHITSSKQRTTVSSSAMRHFAQTLRAQGWPLHYTALDAPGAPRTLTDALSRAIEQLKPQALVLTAPGDWRVLRPARRGTRPCTAPATARRPALFQHRA